MFMSTILSLAICTSLIQSQGETLSPEEIRTRVDEMVDSHFIGLAPSVRKSFANRISGLLLDPKLAKRAAEILKEKELLSAVKYHTSVVRDCTEPADTSKPEIAKLLQEGYEIQVDYLAVRITRALKTEHSDRDRVLLREQVSTLVATARETLKGKLLGDTAAGKIDRVMNLVREEWTAALESPLHSPLDRPLSPTDMEKVLSDIREKAASFTAITPTEEDFSDQLRTQSLKIGNLMHDVREAIYGVGRICFSEFNPIQTREDDWRRRVKKLIP